MQAYTSWWFQRTPKKQSWTTTAKKETPKKLFTLPRKFKSFKKNKKKTWILSQTAWNIEQHSPESSHIYSHVVLENSILIMTHEVAFAIKILLCSSSAPCCSPSSSGLQDAWGERGRSLQSHAGEASAAEAGGRDRKAWPRTTQRYGVCCSRRKTGSVGDWSSLRQR